MQRLSRLSRKERFSGDASSISALKVAVYLFIVLVCLSPFVFFSTLELEPFELTTEFEASIKKGFAVPTNSKPRVRAQHKKKGTSDDLPKTLVIYFPQYHRDPVNDRNWGDNFTDWDSLRQSNEKNRLGRIIPRPLLETPNDASDKDLPPPLGYYDLAQRNPRQTQGLLAKKYGIDGFIYHHYWFYDPSNPGPTLAKPLENMLEDGHPDIPFLLNWCSVSWVNVWLGKAIFQKIPTNKNRAITLQEQYFNATDDMIYQHYQWLKPFFNHPNYISVDGQPAFLVYSYDERTLPILETLRRFAIEDGFPGLHFIVGRSSHHEDLYDMSHVMNEKQYQFTLKKQRQRREVVNPTKSASNVRSIYSEEKKESPDQVLEKKTWDYNPFNQTMTYPYPLFYVTKPYEVPGWCANPGQPVQDGNSTTAIPMPVQAHPEIIGVITAFDNTPRRPHNEATIWKGGKPEIETGESPDEALERFSRSYQAALYYQKCCVIGSDNTDISISRRLTPLESDNGGDRFVAINSMNEWAEGMAIEPSNVYGYRWLETIKAVQEKVKSQRCTVS